MPSSIEEEIGGFTLSIDIAIILYGIVTAQAYFYWWASQEDSSLLRSMVVSVWCIETAHTLFCIYMSYYYTIIKFGNFEGIAQTTWTAGATLFSEITATCCLGLSGFLDVLIAFSQIYFLWTSRSGHQATDNLVQTLMAYIINTGALSMCVSMTIIATFWIPALKSSLLFGGLGEIQSKRARFS
ncbi:uncharacterized protein FIBRA_09034 [Fibroporia radiculosa]|uniref:DUF6534 domain-containing protein n=1 Tax=Fibroporia radiculosa TaxID=599839 RepID=J4GXT9_9APHY|nr:uncharacterized protein FIBRA_09034 [Fibroporia radiculosa]CCM06740.1 predicted protein [Fibroporia radiculosa]